MKSSNVAYKNWNLIEFFKKMFEKKSERFQTLTHCSNQIIPMTKKRGKSNQNIFFNQHTQN